MNYSFHHESVQDEKNSTRLGLTRGVEAVPRDAVLGSDFVLSAFSNCPRWRFDQHFLPVVQYANEVSPTEKPLFTHR